jgi:putative sterol carrier protein
MPDPVEDFFDQVAKRGHEPLFDDLEFTLRFDLQREGETDHWYVTVADGEVRVSREVRPADCVAHMDRAVFLRLITGETAAQAAWLRSEITVEGNPVPHRLFDRIYSGPAGARDPRDLVDRGRRPR